MAESKRAKVTSLAVVPEIQVKIKGFTVIVPVALMKQHLYVYARH